MLIYYYNNFVFNEISKGCELSWEVLVCYFMAPGVISGCLEGKTERQFDIPTSKEYSP